MFETLAGRPAFGGHTIAEILHATKYEQPPALTGSPAVAAVDRVIRRAHGQASRRSPLVCRRDGRGASRRPRRERRRYARPRARAHPDCRSAVSGAAAGPGDGLPCVQPGGRDCDVAVRHRLAGRSFERRGGALCQRDAGSEGARRRGGCRSRRARCGAAGRRSAPCDGAARRGAGRHADRVAHGAVVAWRSLRAPGSHRQPRRGCAGDAACRHARHTGADAGRAAPSTRVRAVPARERARPHLRGPRPGARRLSAAASIWIRTSLQPGRSSGAAIA